MLMRCFSCCRGHPIPNREPELRTRMLSSNRIIGQLLRSQHEQKAPVKLRWRLKAPYFQCDAVFTYRSLPQCLSDYCGSSNQKGIAVTTDKKTASHWK